MSPEKRELYKPDVLLLRLRTIIAIVNLGNTLTAAYEIKRLAVDLDKQHLAKPLADLLRGEI